MAKVAVVVGSKSDLEIVKESGMLEVFNEMGVPIEVSIISAHRNPDTLPNYCQKVLKRNDGRVIFIAIAGMAAALAGAIAAHARKTSVIGVPLPSREKPEAEDALYAMLQMPKDVPVAVPGIGKSGLYKAAILACQILALTDSDYWLALDGFIKDHHKEPQIDISLSEEEE